eukprot:6212109-Pleurochrysis_carterae.AAC.3
MLAFAMAHTADSKRPSRSATQAAVSRASAAIKKVRVRWWSRVTTGGMRSSPRSSASENESEREERARRGPRTQRGSGRRVLAISSLRA